MIATHDQGVIAVVHPDENWRVEEVDRKPNTFVHEIEIGDVDGDGVLEFFATPSKPNKLDQEQPGEVRMYKHTPTGWQKSIVDAPGDTHAKEILTADVDRDGVAELYVVVGGRDRARATAACVRSRSSSTAGRTARGRARSSRRCRIARCARSPPAT